MTNEIRPPVPPFTRETAIQKVRMAEDGWNSRDPQRVSLVYTEDSQWRNRAEFPRGRPQIIEFLTRKWARELEYRLIKPEFGIKKLRNVPLKKVRVWVTTLNTSLPQKVRSWIILPNFTALSIIFVVFLNLYGNNIY